MQEIYDLGEGPLIVIGISCSLWCFEKKWIHDLSQY